MDELKLSKRIVPAIAFIGLALCIACIGIASLNFYQIYLRDGNLITSPITPHLGGFARSSFIATYGVFTCFVLLSLIITCISKSIVRSMIAVLVAVISSMLAIYSIRLTIPIALPLALGVAFGSALFIPFAYNVVTAGFASLSLIALQYNPHLFGISIIAMQQELTSVGELRVFTVVVFCSSVFGVVLRALGEFYSHAGTMLIHQQQVTTQLSLFNQRLQEHAKEASVESAQKERNRISREMHDSAGYVYTNIMALIDAAISGGGKDWAKTEDLLHAASIQARDGLQETRRTLRQLRAIEPPLFSSIESIYKITKIFSEVTNIIVDIEIGNMEKDYGQYINRTICRIVQEALTNSVRHGRATKVVVQFWVSHQKLCMIVTDNGVGSKMVVKGIGLAGMEERLEPLGGNVEIATPEEGGFRLIIHIPLQQELEHQQ